MSKNKRRQIPKGFTIVELLVVIVVVGILAAITVVSYMGINQKANVASLRSDLSNAHKQLELFQVENGKYPNTLDCSQPDSALNKCIRFNSSFSYQYFKSSDSSYNLTLSLSSVKYNVNQNGTITSGNGNLLPNSQELKTSPNNVGTGTAVKMTDEDIPYWRVTGTSWISTYEGPIYALPLTNGSTYTVSCEVRVPVTGYVAFYGNKGVNANVPANVWTKIKYTFVGGAVVYGSTRVGGHTYPSGTTLDYRNWKVEAGSEATDWTP